MFLLLCVCVYVPESREEVVKEDGSFQSGEIKPWAEFLAAAERSKEIRTTCLLILPTPWIELERLVVNVSVKVNRSEVGENTPAFGYNELATFHLDISHGFSHNSGDHVPHP